ncbi:hypothetical protein ACH4NW_35775, partial [Streptomyces globisporus]|uniref:hypothetical protein n=1 Tax=Streptomyces globisporus TaxID=1908 RepID=UPI00378FFF29
MTFPSACPQAVVKGRKRPDRVGPAERESAKANYLEAKCETRFDRESDAKESDRVGNARQQDKEEKRREAPG